MNWCELNFCYRAHKRRAPSDVQKENKDNSTDNWIYTLAKWKNQINCCINFISLFVWRLPHNIYNLFDKHRQVVNLRQVQVHLSLYLFRLKGLIPDINKNV